MPSGIFTLRQQEIALNQGAWSNQKPIAVDYLVVAGGGGGAYLGGGGGAGGLLQGNLPVSTGTAITVTVGAGGGDATTGSNSVFSTITTLGGGGGGNYSANNGKVGGSGGGGSGKETESATRGGQGTLGQGNAGGSGPQSSSAAYRGGGGGGAGALGRFTGANAGGGGTGTASDISGTRTVYAGGGGGAADSSGVAGSGGAGGGGAGGASRGATGGSGSVSGENGTANTGGGGGGYGVGGAAGSGGSGIVIVRYPDIYAAAASTTGSPTISTSGSGSISFNGSNQYLTGPSTSALNYGTGNFTVEFWVYATTIGALSIFFSASNGAQDFQLALSPTNYLYWHNNGIQISNPGNPSSCPLNQWNHIVFVRSGSSCALYCNGTRFGTTTNLSSINLTQFFIGSYWNAAPNYLTTGNITNVRVSNTNMYDPSSSSITVPTAPFAPLSSTNFLLSAVSGSQYVDNSSSNLTLGAPNSPPWAALSPFATGLGYKNRVYTWTSSGSITF